MTLYRAVSEAEDREAFGTARFILEASKALLTAYWRALDSNRRARLVVELRAEDAP